MLSDFDRWLEDWILGPAPMVISWVAIILAWLYLVAQVIRFGIGG